MARGACDRPCRLESEPPDRSKAAQTSMGSRAHALKNPTNDRIPTTQPKATRPLHNGDTGKGSPRHKDEEAHPAGITHRNGHPDDKNRW